MEPLSPMFWGPGMFLQPQHFQQQDRYHEARLRRYVHWLTPFGWGVKSLVINETALQHSKSVHTRFIHSMSRKHRYRALTCALSVPKLCGLI
jgi:predicted component of type VI protein secretion system